jgi:hypothetical protein
VLANVLDGMKSDQNCLQEKAVEATKQKRRKEEKKNLSPRNRKA